MGSHGRGGHPPAARDPARQGGRALPSDPHVAGPTLRADPLRRRVGDVPRKIAMSIAYTGPPAPFRSPGGGRAMLRFQTPLTAAAKEILIYYLHVAADETVEWDEDQESWAAAYPLASACFTPELAGRVLLELLDTLDAPELYVPTNDHWLLMYYCLKEQIALFNDAPVASVVTRLGALACDQDTAYLHLLTRVHSTAGVWIDFDAYIDAYFWDADVLLDAGVFGQLTLDAK